MCASMEELALMNSATLMERERCAKIAEDWHKGEEDQMSLCCYQLIAARIRKGE